MRTGLTTAERRFWLRWVFATALGSLLSGVVSGAVVLNGEMRFGSVSSPITSISVMAVTEAVAFTVHGALVGLAQGMVLRHSLARSGWWAGATTGGWAAAGILSGVLAGAFGGGLTHVGPDAGPLGVVVTAAGSIAAFLFLAFPLAMAGAAAAGGTGWTVGAGVSGEFLSGDRPRIPSDGGGRPGHGMVFAFYSGLGPERGADGLYRWRHHRSHASADAAPARSKCAL